MLEMPAMVTVLHATHAIQNTLFFFISLQLGNGPVNTTTGSGELRG